MPESILKTQPDEQEWIIEGTGRAQYAFRLVTRSRIIPREDLKAISIPDATPEIIRGYAQGMNRRFSPSALQSIDRHISWNGNILFAKPLAKHTCGRCSVEIDEVYVGVDRRGCHYVVPVQAKTGNDQIGVVQTRQDLQLCAEKFPGIAIRAISAQFMDQQRIAMFEIEIEDDRMVIIEERHYRLVPNDEIDDATIQNYRV